MPLAMKLPSADSDTAYSVGVVVRVIDPEHLAALAFQAGGRKRRERAWLLIEAGSVSRPKLQSLLTTHGIKADLDDES